MFKPVAYCRDTPKIWREGAVVRMELPSGDSTIGLAIPIHELLRNMRMCQKLIDEWDAEQRGQVVPIRREAGH